MEIELTNYFQGEVDKELTGEKVRSDHDESGFKIVSANTNFAEVFTGKPKIKTKKEYAENVQEIARNTAFSYKSTLKSKGKPQETGVDPSDDDELGAVDPST
ncbi:MAG: hypothetical protein V3U72_04285 [Candidatus Aenigmarchaeota archaeon]